MTLSRAKKSTGNTGGIELTIKPILVRKQFLITDYQAKQLRDMAHHSGMSESEIVRTALTAMDNTI